MRHQENTYDTQIHLKDKLPLNTSTMFDIKTEFLSFFEFRTEHSRDFEIDTIKLLTSAVNRKDSHQKLLYYVKYFIFAEQIEQGIFEFTLTTVTKDNILPQLAANIYEDKLNDICKNLDMNDEYILNKTLLPSVTYFRIDPFYIAYLSPSQLHPERWEDELKKRAERINMKNNVITTDLYTCYKCGNKKCTTAQVQTRGADEPMTIFVTCVICYNAFTQ